MQYQELAQYTESHPSLLLLRERRAPLILAFFYESFQGSRLEPKKEEELLLNLAQMMEELEITSDSDDTGETDYLGRAKRLLDQWCGQAKRYLRRYTDDKGEILYELTSFSEKTLRWLDELAPREFVGTESRFTFIYQGIKELLEGSQEDPEERIRQLTEKRNELDREIEKIRTGSPVSLLEDWQIRERFDDISRNARTLISDFREVEENFKEIIRTLFEEEINHHSTRGDLLKMTMDASERMKDTPQGKSFYSFWQFLSSDLGNDQIHLMVMELYTLLEQDEESDPFLADLKYYLHQGGMKILDTNHRLAEKLNRLLTDRQLGMSRKLREDIGAIKSLVLDKKENLPSRDDFMNMEGTPDIQMKMERALSFPAEKTRYDLPSEETDSPRDLSSLYDPWAIDPREIKRNIQAALLKTPVIHLDELLELYPPRKGLGELLSYLDAASRNRKAVIDDTESVVLHYVKEGRTRYIQFPKVVFSR